MKKSRAETFIGFCIKAGKLTCGFNAIATQRKDVFLLLLCSGASENAKKSAIKLMDKFHCEMMILLSGELERITGRENCKIAAVRDKNLANAILQAEDENFRKYSGGNIQ